MNNEKTTSAFKKAHLELKGLYPRDEYWKTFTEVRVRELSPGVWCATIATLLGLAVLCGFVFTGSDPINWDCLKAVHK